MAEKVDARIEVLIPAGPGTWYTLARDGRLALPAAEVRTEHGCSFTAAAIERTVKASYGLDVHVLSYLGQRRRTDGQGFDALALAENHAPGGPAVDGLRPAGLADLEALALASDAHDRGLRAWLAEMDSGEIPPQRVPWARPGWRAEALAWAEARLSRRGLALAGPIRVERTWSLSCVLKLPTSGGDYYLKAVPPLFGQEPALTQYLAERFPGQVPEVAACAPERGWLLMRGFSGPVLQAERDLGAWRAALRGYAELQAALAANASELLSLGCPDRRLGALAQAAPGVIAAREAQRVGAPNGLSAAEVEELEALLPALQAACARLDSLGLPATLEHGDLHGYNIVRQPGGGWLYFDWTDGCLAHPFMFQAAFLERAPAEWQPALFDAYLEPWRAYAAGAVLREALRLAQPLAALHLAISYRLIWEQTEPGQRWQLAGALPFFLKEVLRLRDGLGG